MSSLPRFFLALALTLWGISFSLGFSIGGCRRHPSPALLSSSYCRSSTCLTLAESASASENTEDNEPAAEDVNAAESSSSEDEEPASSSLSTDTSDILNSPVFLKRKLEVLQNDLAKVEVDLIEAKHKLELGKQEWGSQLDDLQKEYGNIQERMNSQSKKGDNMATVQVVRQMLQVLDTFDRAFGVVQPSTPEEETIEAEYKQTYQSVLDTFAKLGVEEVKTLGTEFDYQVHQAVMSRPSDEYEEGIVCEEYQKGFKLGDTLVRAAMVAVAA